MNGEHPEAEQYQEVAGALAAEAAGLDPSIILPSDPRAATYRTDIKGWVSRDGKYYGNDGSAEKVARYAGSTHSQCPCGAATRKSRVHCDPCQHKCDRERYEKLEVAEWKGEPLTMFRGDEFFWDQDQLIDYCRDNGCDPDALMLVLAEPRDLRQVDGDYWSDDLPEDGDLPAEIQTALEALNQAIFDHGKAVSYWGGNKRVDVKLQEGWNE